MRPRILILIPLAAALACFLLFSHWPPHSFASSSSNDGAKQPLILELFTSEGCSSCPPADSLLAKLSADQPFDGIEIIALEEHVDYWNSDGWTDRFSSPDFTIRQQEYARLLPAGGVYTPQMIVDGRAQFVGSHAQEAQDQIRSAASHPKSRLLLTPTASRNSHSRSFNLTLDPSSASPTAGTAVPPAIASLFASTLSLLQSFTLPPPPFQPGSSASAAPFTPALERSPSSPPTATLDLWIAITEKDLHSSVTAGENSGQTLQHAPIVRQLRKLKSISLPLSTPIPFTFDLHKDWQPANLTVVAFLSNPHSHQIQAAGSLPIAP